MKKLLFLLMSLSLAVIGQVYKIGDWTITTGGSLTVAYKGKTVLSKITYGSWTPGYKSMRFSDGDMTAKQDGNTVTLTKQSDVANAVMSFLVEKKSVTISLDVDIKPSGPFEYGFYIPIEAFRNADGVLFTRLDRAFFNIEKDLQFNPYGGRSFTIELPEIRHRLENLSMPNFTMQDRRMGEPRGDEIRYITHTNITEQRKLSYKHRWTLEDDFDEETLRQRGIIYKTPLIRHTVANVPNAGFESGLEHWDPKTNQFLDSNVAKSGKNSVRLEVKDPMTENVYVTRMVPISGGALYQAECFVKTENVEATPGRMSSVGAGLIIEWADKNRKWMAPGEYACDLFGTKDWTKAICKSLRAPDDAGYACIYMALRGTGKVWFDDFKLTLIEQSVDKISPANNVTLDNNCPYFTWLRIRGASSYTVHLSQDEKFPRDKTYKYETGSETYFQLEESLQRGTWYWKVTAPGSSDPAPWSFKQTKKADVDCLPPTVTTKGRRVTDSNQTFTVDVRELGSRREPMVTLVNPATKHLYEGVCTAKDGENYQFTFKAEKGWPKGLTTMRIRARDVSGNESEKDFWLVNVPRPENWVVIDKDGWYVEAGKRIFPIGIYEVLKEDMLEVRRAGFDAVHTYRWEGSQDDVACRQYLDDCWAAEGLRAFIGFDRGPGSGMGIVQGNFEHVAKRVGTLCGHPGLFCWYLFDEPEIPGQYVSPKLLTEFADLIRELDPYHPVVMTTWNKSMINYRRTWDTHWTQAYSASPKGVWDQIEQHKRYLNYESPITLLVNCNDGKQGRLLRTGVKPDPTKFERDYAILRSTAFMSITEETNGLWWWWFARGTNQFYTAAQVPEAWANVVKVVKEIGSLRPIINADAPVKTGTVVVGKDQVEWWVKKVGGKTTLIAISTAEEPIKVELDVPGFGKDTYEFSRYEVKVLTK